METVRPVLGCPFSLPLAPRYDFTSDTSITERTKGAPELGNSLPVPVSLVPPGETSYPPPTPSQGRCRRGWPCSLTWFHSGEGFLMSESKPQTSAGLPSMSVRHHLPAPPGNAPRLWGCPEGCFWHGLRQATRGASVGASCPSLTSSPQPGGGFGLLGAEAA